MCEPVKPVPKTAFAGQRFFLPPEYVCLVSCGLEFSEVLSFILIVELYHSHPLHCRTSQATELIMTFITD